MIDWLELLWKAAEEDTGELLPEEAELLPIKAGKPERAGERGETASAELRPEAQEMQSPVRTRPGTEGLPGATNISDAEETMETSPLPTERSNLFRVLQAAARHPGGAAAQRSRRSETGSALAVLYRQVREAAVPVQSGSRSQGGAAVVREEIPAAPMLTEERLDRSLRRDGRRYDSGMSIY